MKANNVYYRSHNSFSKRIFSVWFRHMRVYTRHLISNGLPPFLEPLILLGGIGLGLGKYIATMNSMPYIFFLATGLLVTSSMFTAAFECSYGTFIRLEFDKVYDGMLAAPISVKDLILGEIFWAASKGFFFSLAVLIILFIFGIISTPLSFPAPFIGFGTGWMFAGLSLFITSFVKSINYFNFYFTGFLSPMFFFSGVFFPITNLPLTVQKLAEIFPLTHSVRLVRAICTNDWQWAHVWDGVYMVVFSAVLSFFAVKRLTKRLVD